MTFKKTLRDLAPSDARLVTNAIHEVRCNYRPVKIHIDTIHEGEVETWISCLPEQLIEPPVRQYFGHELYLMTNEGFLYYFPLLLSLGLMQPTSGFNHGVIDTFQRFVNEGDIKWDFTENTKNLAKRWLEIYPDYEPVGPDDPIMHTEYEDDKFEMTCTQLVNRILGVPEA